MEQKFVINIGRQLGGGGKSVGEELARRLGVKMYDKQLINLAAEQSGLSPELFERADEQKSKSVLSTLIGYLRAPFSGDDVEMGGVLSSDALFKIQSDVIRDIASRESCIFVGRCADYILRDQPNVLNIFLVADIQDRIARISEQNNLSNDEALSVVERIDSKRAAYYNYYSTGTWGEASTYHLCLNSSVLGVDGTADFIVEFLERKTGIKPCK